MTTMAFIFARGGSSMPGKNLRPLLGRSLLARAIDVAKAAKGIDRVIVSTDSEDIAREARDNGADVPFMRPAELATDTAPEWRAWQHAVAWVQQTHGDGGLTRFVSVPTSAPLRLPSDVEKCLAAFDGGACDAVITVRPADRNPFFNMVVLDDSGAARLASKPAENITRRQMAPAMYDITTVAYVASPSFVMRAQGLFDGRVRAVLVPKERAVDIDDEWDLVTAEAYMRHARRH